MNNKIIVFALLKIVYYYEIKVQPPSIDIQNYKF